MKNEVIILKWHQVGIKYWRVLIKDRLIEHSFHVSILYAILCLIIHKVSVMYIFYSYNRVIQIAAAIYQGKKYWSPC
jgi:hypothetical protein